MRERGWRKSNPSSHLFVGLVLIIVGVMSMMARLDMVYGLEILDRGWPLILIGFGFFKVSQSQTGAGRCGGFFWIAIGALFLASQNGYIRVNAWSLIWPICMIWFGISMVWRHRSGSAPSADSTSTIGATAILGGFERRCNSQDFKGGEVTSVMGGCKVDLREAVISGDQAVMNVFILMGGMDLMIPQGWTVVNNVVPIMGGVRDRTQPPKEASKRLVLEGVLMMGGIEVKN